VEGGTRNGERGRWNVNVIVNDIGYRERDRECGRSLVGSLFPVHDSDPDSDSDPDPDPDIRTPKVPASCYR